MKPLALAFSALLLLTACAGVTPAVTIPADATPAQAHCLRQGGTIENRGTGRTKTEFCSLPNGSVLNAEILYKARAS